MALASLSRGSLSRVSVLNIKPPVMRVVLMVWRLIKPLIT